MYIKIKTHSMARVLLNFKLDKMCVCVCVCEGGGVLVSARLMYICCYVSCCRVNHLGVCTLGDL